MQALEPVDFAWKVAQALEELTGWSCCAAPIPEDIGSELPFVVVTALGGLRHDLVVDDGDLSIDVYADTPGAANRHARRCQAAFAALEGHDAAGVHWKVCNVQTAAYNNPDPRHPTLKRATFRGVAVARAQLIEL